MSRDPDRSQNSYGPRRFGPNRPPGRRASERPAPPGSEAWPRPWVQMKYFSYNPCIYRAMLGAVSPDALPGSWVTVFDKEGQLFGEGFFNPGARVPLRVLHHIPPGDGIRGETDILNGAIDRALDLREVLFPPGEGTDTNAYRLIHSDGDGLSGLVVDRYADLLSVEVHSLGVWQRLPRLLDRVHRRVGTRRQVVTMDERVARMEGVGAIPPPEPLPPIRILENGVRYEVDFSEGHKTGFFCDQRENRRALARWTRGKRVLDLCCYTGGFALSARILGQAAEVVAVDLDEKAVARARRNGNLNQVNNTIRWVHADAFDYARQMQRNGERFEVVILDPPKFYDDREEEGEGLRRYEDFNRLGLALVAPGGLLLTCSCSGLLGPVEFERLVIRAAHRQLRKLQFLHRTGAGPDHPVLSNCPESLYLKVIWARVF